MLIIQTYYADKNVEYANIWCPGYSNCESTDIIHVKNEASKNVVKETPLYRASLFDI